MKSRSWRNGSAGACAAISLLAACAAAQPAQKLPAIALVDPSDAAQWQTLVRDAGWRVIAPDSATLPNPDRRVQALAAQVEAAIRQGTVDPTRVYIGGRGEAAAMVFYAISRVPDLWAAGVALGGSPKAAIDTNRVYTANFTLVPVLWVSGEDGKEAADKPKSAGLVVASTMTLCRSAGGKSPRCTTARAVGQAIEALGGEALPPLADGARVAGELLRHLFIRGAIGLSTA